jgi:hypothetical protein
MIKLLIFLSQFAFSLFLCIKLRSHVGSDGILHLDIPLGVTDKEIEIMVTYQQLESSASVKTPE